MIPGPKELRGLVRQLLRQRGLLDNIYGNAGLTTVQCHALIELEQSPCTVEELAVALNIDVANANRTLAILLNNGNICSNLTPSNPPLPVYKLTSDGSHRLQEHHSRINAEISSYLDQLDTDEIEQLGLSLHRYNKAMEMSRHQHGYLIRDLEPADNAAIAAVIRVVSEEYGLGADKGYSIADPALDSLSLSYKADNAAYWVIEHKGKILGGGGIAPLGGEEGVCELQKMYFKKELRGKGLARKLAVKGLKFARQQGYKACYLETTANLKEAIGLYRTLGFKELDGAMGDTGHCDCEIKMLKDLGMSG